MAAKTGTANILRTVSIELPTANLEKLHVF